MIIGISGKIGSGKDTIGKIIQILTLFPNMSTQRVIQHLNKDLTNPNFEIQKFGGVLKDIVCLLINCTREQLENEEFKNTPLGKEWRRWYWYYYKLTTDTFNGKVSPYFTTQEEAEKYFDNSTEDRKYNPFLNDSSLKDEILTPRLLMQLIGTECGRQIIHPNIWVNALMSKYEHTHYLYGNTKYILQDDGSYNPIDLNHSGMSEQDMINLGATKKECNWAITDVRFPNEVTPIEDKGGFVIRVTRREMILQNANSIIDTRLPKHFSETALDLHPFKIRIDNNGTLEELVEKVKIVLIKKHIIDG